MENMLLSLQRFSRLQMLGAINFFKTPIPARRISQLGMSI